MLELMERGHEVSMDEMGAATRLNAVKQEIDSIKWILCKLLPRKYGDKAVPGLRLYPWQVEAVEAVG